MTRKICIVTSSRADYGLLRPLILAIKNNPQLKLQIIVTGMHLSPEFGLTCDEILNDRFKIDKKIEMLLSSDSGVGVAKSMGLGMIGFADTFNDLKPDLIVILGDRFEIFSVAAVALVCCIPIAHIHGGELTEGAYDDAFRHSITKMSYLHFVAADEYRKRVIQLGEHPKRVYLVGGLGVDSFKKTKLLGRIQLEKALNFKLGKRNLLITFHPVTLEFESYKKQMKELLLALKDLDDVHLIFTYPNADNGGRAIIQMLKDYTESNPNAYLYSSLGQLNYFSCINQVDGVVGNSSSGIAEVPSFKKGTINIGNRQAGRLQASSIINCLPNRKSIAGALKKLFSKEFKLTLNKTKNPYGDGGAASKISKIITSVNLESPIKKSFYDFID